MRRLLSSICLVLPAAAGLASGPEPVLGHIANISHEDVQGIELRQPRERNTDIALAVYGDAACRAGLGDGEAVAAVMAVLRGADVRYLTYIHSVDDSFTSALGRFDLYCVPGSGPAKSVVAILTSGSSDRAFTAFGLGRTDSGWEVSFVPQDGPRRLSGTRDYKVLGFLESSGVPWAFALLLDEGANNNIEVIDLEGGEAYAGVGSAVLVREKEDLVLYVSAREWVSEPEHEVVRLRGPGWDQLWSERRISKTHQAKVLRRIDQAGAAIVDKVVYQTPPRDGKSPEDVGEFVRRVEERFKTFREQGLVVAE